MNASPSNASVPSPDQGSRAETIPGCRQFRARLCSARALGQLAAAQEDKERHCCISYGKRRAEGVCLVFAIDRL